MTNPMLVRVPPSDAHRGHTIKSSFDLDDPDRRHPVQSRWQEMTLTAKVPGHDPRQDLLLQARQGAGQVMSRGLCLIGAAIGAMLTATPAEARHNLAFDHPIEPKVPDLPELEILSDPTQPVPVAVDAPTPVDVFTTLPALDDPVWTVGLLALLAATSLTSLGLQITRAIQSKSRSTLMPVEIDIPFDMNEAYTSDEEAKIDEHDDAKSGTKAKSPSKGLTWRTDGASRTGKVRAENQDRFSIRNIAPNRAVLILCDGAGGIEGGGPAACCAEGAIGRVILNLVNAGNDSFSETDLEIAITEAQTQADGLDLPGITTAIVVALEDDRVTYATLGDGNLALIWPDGMVSQTLAPHHQAGQPSNIITAYVGKGNKAPPRTGSVRVEPGTTVMAMSDGAGDLFPFEIYGLTHADQTNVWRELGDGFADRLVAEIEAGRDEDTGAYLHSDNMTIAMAHLEQAEVRHA